MLRVGLTGGIACGKSMVLSRLASRGVPTLDLDLVAHEIIEPGTRGHAEILTAFGRAVLSPDGRIDRKILGSMVFRAAAARARLNAIVHPLVRQSEQRFLQEAEAGGAKVVVLDIPLLLETGGEKRVDAVVVVSAPAELVKAASATGVSRPCERSSGSIMRAIVLTPYLASGSATHVSMRPVVLLRLMVKRYGAGFRSGCSLANRAS